MPRALLSVSNKNGLVDLARALASRGFELVSTGGTARALTTAGLAVTNVADLTGFPEFLDGRVKTLHPALHGGILARRDHPDDLAALARLGIGLVDVVVVNLYPFAKVAADPGTPFDALVEEIDIGGPSLVRAAAKNFRHVLVVSDPRDYPRLVEAIDAGSTAAFRFELMRKAFAHTAEYDALIASTLDTVVVDGDRFTRLADAGAVDARGASAVGAETPRANGSSPAVAAAEAAVTLELTKVRDLRYGENAHQSAAWFGVADGTSGARGFGRATIVQGKELSFTNLLDLDAAARIVLEFDEPAAVVIKHTNPCGAATGASAAEAYVTARDADSLAAFGGIVGLNRSIDVAAASAIVSTFIEAVVAPSIEDNAREVLAKKPNMRVVLVGLQALSNGGHAAADDGASHAAPHRETSRAAEPQGEPRHAGNPHGEPWRAGDVDVRSILGALLVQRRDGVVEARCAWSTDRLPDGVRVVTKRQPTPEEWQALRFAWRLCAHVKSNAVIFTDAHRTLAIGAGQMSRVDAAEVAVMKANRTGISLAGSAAASDAFFPFRDGLDVVAAAGATAIVQPGGSVRDAEVIAAADEHRLAMVFTGRRHFRH
jgi:phosphoribosylaminoimidazolecarboxamide formyltransferase / IMP cyclohydrolase